MKPIMHEEIGFYLKRKIEACLTSKWWKGKEDFACGWREHAKNVFGVWFNVVSGKWVDWNDVKIPSIDNIVVDYQVNELSLRELVHFNPELKNVESFQNRLESEKLSIFILPRRRLFIETTNSKKTTFFLSYAISYQKKLMLMGPKNNGKTTVVQEKLWNLLARGEFGVLQIGLNVEMKGGHFRKKVEMSHLNRESSFLKIYGGKVVLFVDDLNMCSEK